MGCGGCMYERTVRSNDQKTLPPCCRHLPQQTTSMATAQRTYTPTTLLLHILTTTTMLVITKHLITNNTSYLPFTYKNHVPQGDNYHYNPLTKTIATPTSVSTKPTTSNVPITYYHPWHTNENHLPSTNEKHTSPYHETSPTKTNSTTKIYVSSRWVQASTKPITIITTATHTTHHSQQKDDNDDDDDCQILRQGRASHNQLTPKLIQYVLE